MVSGAAALWLSHRRAELKTKYTKPWQIVEAFKACAKLTARKPNDQWKSGSFGEGILDVEALLALPLPEPATLVMDGTNA